MRNTLKITLQVFCGNAKRKGPQKELDMRTLYCKKPEKIENYGKALADNFKGWVCHHRLETHTSDGERRLVDITQAELKALGMYYNRPPEELIFLTTREHNALHHKGKPLSEGHKQRISKTMKDHLVPEETRRKMSEAAKKMWDKRDHLVSAETRKKMSEAKKNMSEEYKKKLSEARKGKHWYHNGKINIMAKECPEGFVPGKLKKYKENYFMKMNLLEYLDRTGKHVSRKTFEKYKDERKSFIAWEVLIR